jgi:hypothetical protein
MLAAMNETTPAIQDYLGAIYDLAGTLAMSSRRKQTQRGSVKPAPAPLTAMKARADRRTISPTAIPHS